MSAESPEPGPPGELRASDSERDAVVERLRDAAAEGRINLAELDIRLEQALSAVTHADLAPVTADLPRAFPPDPGVPLVLKGGLHGASRTGRWQVPTRVVAHGGLGGVRLDFTRTGCRLPGVELEVHGEMAGVTIVIPDGWAVETGGLDPGLGGLRNKTTAGRLPNTPLIRVSGTGGPAGVVIRHPNGRERRKLENNPPL
jgi:Domain of unknown function (DUF1707)